MTDISAVNPLRAGVVVRGLAAVWMGAASAFYVASAAASDYRDMQLLRANERMELEKLLAAEVGTIVHRQRRLDGQGALKAPTVRFTDDGTKLVVELGSGYVPKVNGGEFEDHLMEIANTLMFHTEDVAPVKGVDFVFDGHDIFHYFPENQALHSEIRQPSCALDAPWSGLA